MFPDCKKVWSREFQSEHFTQVFIKTDLKQRQTDVCFDIETALLPGTQILVENIIQRKRLEKEMDILEEERMRIVEDIDNRIHALDIRIRYGEETKKGKRDFIKACPASECKGFLTTGWKCGICDTRVCNKCLEIKVKGLGSSKEGKEGKEASNSDSGGWGNNSDNDNVDENDSDSDSIEKGEPAKHVCKEDDIKSAQFIMKDTKGCPKCGTMIHKISGCAQMWCTNCKTAFNWGTMRIITSGNVHNPHYNEWRLRGGTHHHRPENDNDNDGNECGQIPELWSVRHNLEALLVSGKHPCIFNFKRGSDARRRYFPHTVMFTRLHEGAVVLVDLGIPFLANTMTNTNEDLRIKYMMDDISELNFKKELFKRNVFNKKTIELIQIFQMYTDVIRGLLIEMVQVTKKVSNISQTITKVEDIFKQIVELFEYTNGTLYAHSMKWKMGSGYQIDVKRWTIYGYSKRSRNSGPPDDTDTLIKKIRNS